MKVVKYHDLLGHVAPEDAEAIAGEFVQLRSNSPKVYRTYVPDRQMNGCTHVYVLTTTHKDTHLALGALSHDARCAFCRGLKELLSHEDEEDGLLLLTGDGDRGLHITKTQVTDTVVFNLSFAH